MWRGNVVLQEVKFIVEKVNIIGSKNNDNSNESNDGFWNELIYDSYNSGF